MPHSPLKSTGATCAPLCLFLCLRRLRTFAAKTDQSRSVGCRSGVLDRSHHSLRPPFPSPLPHSLLRALSGARVAREACVARSAQGDSRCRRGQLAGAAHPSVICRTACRLAPMQALSESPPSNGPADRLAVTPLPLCRRHRRRATPLRLRSGLWAIANRISATVPKRTLRAARVVAPPSALKPGSLLPRFSPLTAGC